MTGQILLLPQVLPRQSSQPILAPCFLPAMEQHRRGGRIEGAPFALIGHSIGTMVVTGVAKRCGGRVALSFPHASLLFHRRCQRAPPP